MLNNKGKHKGPPSRIYCCVYGCRNSRAHTTHSFFKLPVNRERRNEWLKNIGREDLLRKYDIKPGSYEVCSMHFDSKMISEHFMRKLLPGAVPTLKKRDDISIPPPKTFSFEVADSLTFNVATQTNDSYIHLISAGNSAGTASEPLDFENWELSPASRKRENQIDFCEPEVKGEKLEESFNDDEITERFYKLVEWQSSVRNKCEGKLDPEYKQFSLNMRLSSPTTYQTMKGMLDLPSESTLARFKLNICPEIDDRIFGAISSKLKSLPGVAKYCTMCVGQMTLKRRVYYNIRKDEIIGFHNVNGSVRNEIASKACVIVIQGIAVNWRQPICYALLANTKHYEQLEDWIMVVLSKLSKVGVKVMAVVSEPGSNFNKFANEVMKVTTEKPYFIFDERKVYYIFDVPSMLTSLRHNLMNNEFFHKGDYISWNHIKVMYSEQKENELHLLPKVTDDHIDLNKNQDRYVKYASQIFSRSVYGALNMFIYNGSLPDEAKTTAEFVKLMNDLFDVLNSNAIIADNNYQRAFTGDKDQVAILNAAHKMFEDITAINRGEVTEIETFENFRMTIQAITMLSKDLKREGINFMLTRRLNLDSLESFFDAVKQETNWRNPTPIQFTRIFSKLALREMLKIPRSTKRKTGVFDLLSKESVCLSAAETIGNPLEAGNSKVPLFPKPAAPISMVSLGEDIDYYFELPARKAMTYVAGYLLLKCTRKHQCIQFIEYMRTARMVMYQWDRNEVDLTPSFHCDIRVPPETFMKYVETLESTIEKHLDELLIDKPANSMLAKLKMINFSPPCACFPQDYLLKLYVRFRLYSILEYNNGCLRNKFKRLKYSVQLNRLS